MGHLNIDELYNPLEVVYRLIGGKYKVNVLFHLMERPKHFSELQHDIPPVSNKMLAQQLKELTSDGLISRAIVPEVPVKTVYSLTEYGKTLCPIIVLMYQWGENVFLAQNRKWNCNDAEIESWMKQNHIPPDHPEKIIREMNRKEK